jgi:hypothetical protein
MHMTSKLNQNNINHLNISITSHNIKAVITILSTKKVQDHVDSLLNSTRTLKKN